MATEVMGARVNQKEFFRRVEKLARDHSPKTPGGDPNYALYSGGAVELTIRQKFSPTRPRVHSDIDLLPFTKISADVDQYPLETCFVGGKLDAKKVKATAQIIRLPSGLDIVVTHPAYPLVHKSTAYQWEDMIMPRPSDTDDSTTALEYLLTKEPNPGSWYDPFKDAISALPDEDTRLATLATLEREERKILKGRSPQERLIADFGRTRLRPVVLV